MAKTTKELIEGFSFAGTFLFSQRSDAEGTAAMLGLQGAFPMETDEGIFWMPGHSYDELMNRIYSEWILPNPAPVPITYLQEPQKTLPFLAYLHKEGENNANLPISM